MIEMLQAYIEKYEADAVRSSSRHCTHISFWIIPVAEQCFFTQTSKDMVACLVFFAVLAGVLLNSRKSRKFRKLFSFSMVWSRRRSTRSKCSSQRTRSSAMEVAVDSWFTTVLCGPAACKETSSTMFLALTTGQASVILESVRQRSNLATEVAQEQPAMIVPQTGKTCDAAPL